MPQNEAPPRSPYDGEEPLPVPAPGRRKKAFIIGGGVLALTVLVALSLNSTGGHGVDVRAELVGRRDLVSVVTASGRIEPRRKVDISADISGRVIEVAVEEGQWVNQGDLLLRIDPNTYAAAVRQAEAAVAQAQARASQARANLLAAESAQKRAEFLAQGEELISAQDLEDARTKTQVARAELEAARFAVQQAQAGLSEARDQLSKTTITAPMGGRVTRLNIEEGETAIIGTMNNPGSLLLTVADLSSMQAKVKVDETAMPEVSVGDSASVSIDAYPGRAFVGRVTSISHSAMQGAVPQPQAEQSVDFEVVITLDTPPEDLRPDLSATADIVTETRRGALAVPVLALARRDSAGKKFKAEDDGAPAGVTDAQAAERRRRAAEVEGVFVVENGRVRFVPVEVGIDGENYFEVRSGLRGGELVVAGPYDAIRNLQADAPVKAQTPPGAQKGGGAAKGAAAANARTAETQAP
jgi:HlyD family secretion protein